MTAQTVTSAVEVRKKDDQLIDWIRGQQDEIAMAAASHVKPSAIVRVAHGALRKNPKLLQAAIANPQSLLYALLDCARLGHEPDTDDYYLVPFGNEVTGIEGYKGIIERMFRAGGVSSVVAQVVRQRDRFASRGQNTPPVHDYDPFASEEDRGPLKGAYAYAIFPGGSCSQVVTMGRGEVMKHKAKSKGSDKPDSPWQQWEEPMWKKCPLRGLEPYVPTSTEYRRTVAAAGQPVPETVADVRITGPSGIPHAATAVQAEPDGEIVDAEVVEEPRQPAAPSADLPGQRPTGAALGKLAKLMRRIPWESPDDEIVFLSWQAGHPVTFDTLTKAECALATTCLDDALAAAQGNTEDAASAIWTQFRDQHAREIAEASGE